jgi:catechol 2,3-dioxygenase-like lactoylglutathione lyase family enzyme
VQATIDHVVIWVDDQLRALDFYERVVGFEGVRAAEFRDGEAPFPSVRVSEHTIIDLMARSKAEGVDRLVKSPGSAGHRVNHICVSVGEADYRQLRDRLEAEGVDTSAGITDSFGARGHAPDTFYFADPDGNIIEARYYG